MVKHLRLRLAAALKIKAKVLAKKTAGHQMDGTHIE